MDWISSKERVMGSSTRPVILTVQVFVSVLVGCDSAVLTGNFFINCCPGGILLAIWVLLFKFIGIYNTEYYAKLTINETKKRWKKMRLERKGIVILFSMALLFLLGPNGFAQPIGIMSPKAQNISEYAPLSCPGGRFVFGQISDSSKDQYMLDTWTGRLWRLSESGEVGKYLSPVPYELKSGKYGPVPEEMKNETVRKGHSRTPK